METVTSNVHTIPNSSTETTDDLPVSANAMSALSYFIGLVAIAALVMRDYSKNKTVRFHAVQALLFQGSWVVSYIAIAITTAIFSTVVNLLLGSLKLYAMLGLMIALPSLVSLVFTLGMLGTWLFLIVSASQGKTVKLPVLGRIAERIAAR